MKNALKKGMVFILLSSSSLWGQSTFQTSQSCDCIIDTLGLASYLSTLSLSEDSPLSIEVEDPTSTFAVLHGYIDGTTPDIVDNFITSYPEVTTLVFMQMPGSDDDEANLEASYALYEEGYKFYLPAVNAYDDDAFIASGAVDMFLAGAVRVVDENGEVGVHSWSDGVNEATDYPEGSPEHQPYIDYYVSIGFSIEDAESFYYFTIEAAPAAGIHLMTESEIEQYKLRTCIYSESPTYTVTQNENILTANLSGATYQWVDCENDNDPIDGATSQTYIAETNGIYAVIITEENCEGMSDCFVVNSVGVEKVRGYEFSIYPTPTYDYLTVTGEDVSNKLIQIFDIIGKELAEELRIDSLDENNVKLDVKKLPAGTYILMIEQTIEKIVVK